MSKPILMDEKGKLIRGTAAIQKERLKAYFELEYQKAKLIERELKKANARKLQLRGNK